MIKEGKIVPAEVTVGLLEKAMRESGNDKFLIDGFPRNDDNRIVFERQVWQYCRPASLVAHNCDAKTFSFPLSLQTGIEPQFILFFDCPEEVMEQRLLGRNQVTLPLFI